MDKGKDIQTEGLTETEVEGLKTESTDIHS